LLARRSPFNRRSSSDRVSTPLRRSLPDRRPAFDRLSSLVKGTISCLVRNVSISGACLEVASPVGIPDTFMLLMESDHIKRQCQVAWMKDKRIGIHFV
jgi:hypothetical protein